MHTFYFFLYSFFIFLQSLCFYTSIQFYIFVYTFCALCSFTHFVLYGFCAYCSYTLLLLCSYENPLRRIKYSSNPWLFRLLKYSAFNSFPSSNTVSETTPIAYHSLCSISLTYGMPCIAIARYFPLNHFLGNQKISLRVASIMKLCHCPHVQYTCNQKVLLGGFYLFVKVYFRTLYQPSIWFKLIFKQWNILSILCFVDQTAETFNPNLDGLFRDSFGGGGGKTTPIKNTLELRYKVENWHLSTHTYAVLENIPFTTENFLILLMSDSLAKYLNFLAKFHAIVLSKGTIPLLKTIA